MIFQKFSIGLWSELFNNDLPKILNWTLIWTFQQWSSKNSQLDFDLNFSTMIFQKFSVGLRSELFNNDLPKILNWKKFLWLLLTLKKKMGLWEELTIQRGRETNERKDQSLAEEEQDGFLPLCCYSYVRVIAYIF